MAQKYLMKGRCINDNEVSECWMVSVTICSWVNTSFWCLICGNLPAAVTTNHIKVRVKYFKQFQQHFNIQQDNTWEETRIFVNTEEQGDMKDEKYIFTVAVVFSQTLFCLVFLADEDKNLFDLSGFQRILESF